MSRAPLLVLLTALAVGLSPAAASADPFTEHLDALQAELADRLENDFGGALDKPAKKQQKAVEKSLKFLAKESDSAADDLKALDKSTKKLAKAYPSEFEPGSKDQTLLTLVDGAVGLFRLDALDRRQELEYVVPTLSPASLVGQVGKLHDKAAEELAKYNTAPDPFARIKIVAKATKFLDKAFAKVAKDKGEGVYLLIGTDGGSPIVTDAPFAEWNDSIGELQLFGQRTNAFGLVTTVVVVMEGVTGPGSYPFTGDGWSGYYEVGSAFSGTRYDIVAGSGALVVDELDIAGSVVSGSFAFDAFNEGNMTTLEFPIGEFRLTTIHQ